MAVRESILQTARAWLKTSLSLSDAQVIVSSSEGDAGPRPALPYLSVDVTGIVQVGEPEDIYSLDGSSDPRKLVSRLYAATLVVHGYGESAIDFLIEAEHDLDAPTIQSDLDAAGVTIRVAGAAVRVPVPRDTAFEAHTVQEFDLSFKLNSDFFSLTELAVVELEEFELQKVPLDETDPTSLSQPRTIPVVQ